MSEAPPPRQKRTEAKDLERANSLLFVNFLKPVLVEFLAYDITRRYLVGIVTSNDISTLIAFYLRSSHAQLDSSPI